MSINEDGETVDPFPPERIRFSQLRNMGQSPMHFRHACEQRIEATSAMRAGTLIHSLVLGGDEVTIYEGARRGNAWKKFAEDHFDVEIFTRAEVDRVEPIAAAVLKDPIAAQFLEGEHEVQLEWDRWGRKCRGRLDILNREHGFVADLKSCRDAQPDRFRWDALKRKYHAQLEWYRAGAAAAVGVEVKHHYLVTVETKPPYPVVVRLLSPRAIEEGERINRAWMERLRVCEESNEWPGYAQCVLDLDVDEGVDLIFGDEDEEDDS